MDIMFDKAIVPPNTGMPAPAGPEEAIVVELPEEVQEELMDAIEEAVELQEDFDANLADELDEEQLGMLANDLCAGVKDDMNSRTEWLKLYVQGLDLLGTRIEQRTEPWDGACGINHPILTEALVKFQADSIMSTFPAQGPVKTVMVGKETPEKKKAAARVKEDMNFRLTEEMTEFRPEHERMLWGLGLSGNAFKKVYFDPERERQVSTYVQAEDLVVPYGASELKTAERVTHVMRKTKSEVARLMQAGFYTPCELGDPVVDLEETEAKIAKHMGFEASQDNRYRIYEVHALLDLADYEYNDPFDPYEYETENQPRVQLPYVVTVESGNNKVVAIRRNWAMDDANCAARQHFVHYSYIPGFGFYSYGLVHLLGAFAKGATSILRQLVDAGELANLPAGFKSKDLRVRGDNTPLSPGEFRDVDVTSGTIRDALYTLEFKGPNPTLFQLLTHLEESGRRFASIADMKISDMSADAPVGTTLALLERQLKVMTAVQARMHHSLRQELRLLKGIIRDHTSADYEYEPDGDDATIKQADYDMVDIMPVSDPNAATMSQKVVQYQAAMQLAQGAPEIYNRVELHRQMLEVLGMKEVDKIVPTEDDMLPQDPVTENMAVLNGKPVKAFIHQDHEAHIAAHMAAIQDPKIAALAGQNPNAQAIMATAMAHINEHLGFLYRAQLEEQMGVPLPPPDEPLPPEIEVQLSKAVAEAAGRLLGKHQQEAAQQQAQQENQDPHVQMMKAELEIKQRRVALEEAELMLKKQKQAIDAAAKSDDIELRGKQVAVDAAHKADQLELQREEQGSRAQLESARVVSQAANMSDQTELQEQRMRMDALYKQLEAEARQQAQQQPQQGGER